MNLYPPGPSHTGSNSVDRLVSPDRFIDHAIQRSPGSAVVRQPLTTFNLALQGAPLLLVGGAAAAP